MVLQHLLKPVRSHLTTCSPHHLLLRIKIPRQTTVLIKEKRHNSSLSLRADWFPASLQKYSKVLIICGETAPASFWHYRVHLQQPPAHCYWVLPSHGPLWQAVSSTTGLWAYVTNNQSVTAFVLICPMSGVLPSVGHPHNPGLGGRIPPSLMR